MGFLTMRYFLSLGNVAVSLFLGALLFALCAIYNPVLLETIFGYAAIIRDRFLTMISNDHLRVVLRPVVHESSIVLMMFTLLSRIVVGAFIALGAWFIGLIRGDDEQRYVEGRPRRR
jgi:hypothetical protein